MAELPHLLQLQEKHPNDIVAISLNVDHDEEKREPSETLQNSVRKKLAELNMQVVNIISREPTDPVLEHFDIFSLPGVLIYSRDGQLVKKFEGNFTYVDDVFPFIEKQLAN